ncbi:PepSY domain-containing protein [Methylobacterium organophilum]|uniref:PepSY domain-containing protein n=1 Tax=Methylobacterium organophilum TaxID=410 RepID=UPI003B8453BC
MPMTSLTKPLLAAALTLGALAGPALADVPGKDWMPIDQALRKLTEAGYTDIRSLEADDGVWEGKALKDGKAVKVTVDPHDGTIAEKTRKRDRRAD